MVIEKEYNGYTNYETWLVSLWIDNDECTCDLIHNIIRHSKDVYEASEELKEYVEENNPLADTANLFTDLLNSALSEVDYADIIRSHTEEEE
jgi:hypothetical protein